MSSRGPSPRWSTDRGSKIIMDAAGNDEKKGDHINIRVVGNDGSEVFFKIRKNTPLRKLMDSYCEKQGKGAGTVRFMYEGIRIRPDSTAEQLKIENDDQIDVMPEQVGGYAY